MSPATAERQAQSSKRLLVVQVLAYLAGVCLVVPVEIARLVEAISSDAGLGAWFVDMNLDTTPWLLLLAAAPLFWWVRRPLLAGGIGRKARFRSLFDGASKPTDRNDSWAGGRAWLLAVVVGLTSWALSASIAATDVAPPAGAGREEPLRFGDLPPAYHDEYSYLFQAKTFLAGRLSFPSHPTAPELFDQVHVLNEGRFASRYFPAAGAWIAPFLAGGNPYWGHWLAGALAAVFLFWAGRELGGDGVGFLAGMLTALSPGMGLFSNLLLAHHPTLMGLTLFLFSFLRMMRTRHWGYALLAGTGLSFAMLARPMTAAGFGLPFGAWLFWWLWKGGAAAADADFGFRLRRAAALGAPVLFGIALMFPYNQAITGEAWTTPYQRYTDIYTPRHVYGFDNVVRGERRLGPKVLDNYDRWAENLTPALAVRNVGDRLIASWQWTLGLVPLVMATAAFVGLVPASDRRWWLILAAIVSLHVVHVPYWYAGIMNWHYVFESGPLWLLVFAGATQSLVQSWRATSRPGMPIWWSALVGVALLTSHTSPEPFWPTARLEAGIHQVAFARLKHQAFQRMLERQVTRRPALVLIEADPHDRHIDYVVNDPDLQGEVLLGRYRPGQTGIAEVQRLFPDRALFLFHAAEWRITPLGGP